MLKAYNILLALFFFIPLVLFAHPGNTSSDGMHYCWTNCASWGEIYGERHGHGGGSYTPSYNNYYYSTPTCPTNSYSSGSSCKCNYGYVASGNSCISGESYCTQELGLMSSYDSLTNSCKCMSGYEIGLSGTCTYKSKYSSSHYDSLYSNYSSKTSCPPHSSESEDNPTMCTCDVGFEVNNTGSKCVKISKKKNDKLCQAEFGTKSEWNRKYSDDGFPMCKCKKNYVWSLDGDSCVR